MPDLPALNTGFICSICSSGVALAPRPLLPRGLELCLFQASWLPSSFSRRRTELAADAWPCSRTREI